MKRILSLVFLGFIPVFSLASDCSNYVKGPCNNLYFLECVNTVVKAPDFCPKDYPALGCEAAKKMATVTCACHSLKSEKDQLSERACQRPEEVAQVERLDEQCESLVTFPCDNVVHRNCMAEIGRSKVSASICACEALKDPAARKKEQRCKHIVTKQKYLEMLKEYNEELQKAHKQQ